MKTLLYGIGNPLRGDDGVGAYFVEHWEGSEDLHFQFQLQIEDTELFSKYERVIIIDAIKNISSPFVFKRLYPQYENSFTTHSLKPQSVLAMTEKLYDQSPQLYLCGIYAENFEMDAGIGPSAMDGLLKAKEFMTNWLYQKSQEHYHS